MPGTEPIEIGSNQNPTFEVTGGSEIRCVRFPLEAAEALERLVAVRDSGCDDADAIPPNDNAINATRTIIIHALLEGLPISRVLADPEGGAAVYFFGEETDDHGGHPEWASVECDNEGELFLLLHRRGAEAEPVRGFDLEQAQTVVRRAAAFLQHRDSAE